MSLLSALKIIGRTSYEAVNSAAKTIRLQAEEKARIDAVVTAAWNTAPEMFKRDPATLDSLTASAIVDECMDNTNQINLNSENPKYGGRPEWLGKARKIIHVLDTEDGVTTIPTQKASYAYAQKALAHIDPVFEAYTKNLPNYITHVVTRLTTEITKVEQSALDDFDRNQIVRSLRGVIDYLDKSEQTPHMIAAKLGFVSRELVGASREWETSYSDSERKVATMYLPFEDLRTIQKEATQIGNAYNQMLRYVQTLRNVEINKSTLHDV